ncbi:PDR/VanB family oxidoreductase [Herbiconiux sp.]|uniref:PDR/VanB family oxidoreductase n=1 Tax=Herbiconiux sp. TaxID=1871186 RepID=UPI0025BEAEF7|nr:PDR/VanB family oxidoreductase [Herbiconiux sp.]
MTATSDADRLDLIVTSMALEADGVLSVELRAPDRGTLPSWSPGAHLSLQFGGAPVRQYSLCGDPSDSRRYRVAVLREPASRGGSEFVHATLRVGDHVAVAPPRNHFPLDVAERYVFVAGGIGITPILPMIAEVSAAGKPWSLHYYGRSRSSMAFLDDLERYGEAVSVVVPGEPASVRPADAVAAVGADGRLYACGPSRLMAELDELASEHGVAELLRTELFAAPEPDGTEPLDTDAFTVRLEESGLELVVPPERSILDVVLEAGVDVLHDCAEGICGSCETSVVSGTPDHRDHVLTAQERQENSCMMICVSRSTCPVLVLGL